MGSLFLARKSPEQIEAEKRQIRLREWYSHRTAAAPIRSVTTAGTQGVASTANTRATLSQGVASTGNGRAASAQGVASTASARAASAQGVSSAGNAPVTNTEGIPSTGDARATATRGVASAGDARATTVSTARPSADREHSTPASSPERVAEAPAAVSLSEAPQTPPGADEADRFHAALRAAADAISRLPQGVEWAADLIAEWKRLEALSETPTTEAADAAAELAVDAIWMANQLKAQTSAMQRLREYFERKEGYRLQVLEGGRLAVQSDEFRDFTMVWDTTIGDEGLSVEADVFAAKRTTGERTADAPPADVQETIHRVQAEAVAGLAEAGIDAPKGPCSFGPRVPVLEGEDSPEKQGKQEGGSRRLAEGGCHGA